MSQAHSACDWLKPQQEEERHELEQRQRERRETAIARLASHGLSILNIARHCLNDQEREEKVVLRDRQSQSEKPERLPRFKYWLGKRTPYLANLWRFRKRIAPGVEVRQREFSKTGNQASPYAVYRKMVKKRFPEKMDESRLDAAIALYMRCAGYTMREVANELYRHMYRPALGVKTFLNKRNECGHVFGIFSYVAQPSGLFLYPYQACRISMPS